MRILKAALIALAVWLAQPAVAGPNENARAAFDRNDYAKAIRIWRLLAEQGNAAAQYNLGVMYYIGRGVPRNYILAHIWWNLAAATGDNDAHKNRDIVAKKMTPTQIAEAQKLAREWKPKKSR